MTEERQGVKLESEVIVVADAIIGGGLNLRAGQIVAATKLQGHLEVLLRCGAVEVLADAAIPNAYLA